MYRLFQLLAGLIFDENSSCCLCLNTDSSLILPHRAGDIIKWALASVCLSVCLSVYPSVCPVPRPNSITERLRMPEIGRTEVHHMSNPWTYLEVKRSKVNVTRPINAHTVNEQYLPQEKAYEHQTSYADGARRPASATSDVTYDLQGQRSRSQGRVLRLTGVGR